MEVVAISSLPIPVKEDAKRWAEAYIELIENEETKETGPKQALAIMCNYWRRRSILSNFLFDLY